MASMSVSNAENAASAARLFALFDSMEIPYKNHEHPPTSTATSKVDFDVPAEALTKNLFLKDDKGGFWIITALVSTKIDFKTLAGTLEVKRLRFGSEESLLEHLGIKGGSVTMFALMNDQKKMVFPLIDEEITKHEWTCNHPLHNEATTVIATKDLFKFINGLGRGYRILKKEEMSPFFPPSLNEKS